MEEAVGLLLIGFDASLAVVLAVVATRALATGDRFESVVLYIVFGLTMALAWTRLGAPDVALAEAAIGAGVTGALFLNALGHAAAGEPEAVEPEPVESDEQDNADERPTHDAAKAPLTNWLWSVPYAVAALAIFVPLALAGWEWRHAPLRGLSSETAADLPRSGASNPVTAVLLNYRSYDTLLEVAVLLVAVMGVWSLGALRRDPEDEDDSPPGAVLQVLVRFLGPLVAVVAAYLLWIGTKSPGGAFQAGALLSAAGVLMLAARIAPRPSLDRWLWRTALVVGLLVFLAVAIGTLAAGRELLQYPTEWAATLILLIEGAVALSIAASLVSLFAGGPDEGGIATRHADAVADIDANREAP